MVLKLFNLISISCLEESRREIRVSLDASHTSSGKLPGSLNSPGPSEASTSSRESRRGRQNSEESGDVESYAKKQKTLKAYQIKLLALTTRPYKPSAYRVDPTATKLCTPIKGKPYSGPEKLGSLVSALHSGELCTWFDRLEFLFFPL